MAFSDRAHVGHEIVLGGWAAAVVLAMVVDQLVSSWRRRSGRQPTAVARPSRRMAPINAAAFIATWPPPPLAHRTGGPAARVESAVGASTLLQVAALANLVAASVHLAVVPDHFAQSALYGCFFVVVAGVQVGLAVGLVAAPSRRLVRVATAGSAAIVVLWAYTRVVGVPIGVDHGATEPVGVLDVLATGAEVISLGTTAWLWQRRDQLRAAWSPRRWSASFRWVTPAVLLVVGYLIWVSPKG